MKQISFCILAFLFLVSCNSNSSKKDNSGSTTENSAEISNEQINNPATASNPTATPSEFAIMSFKNTDHNFGDILENQKVETTYEFTNTGKVDLLINDCRASCGCTVPNWPKTPIKPGASGVIKVVFDSAGKSGENNKIVTVKKNKLAPIEMLLWAKYSGVRIGKTK
jgi:hypothetical protein